MEDPVLCPSCKHEISKRAKVCPKCGHNTAAQLHAAPGDSRRGGGAQSRAGSPALKPQRSNAARRT